ncbi:MAG: aldo/keto reductase [Candidatus Latescibacterota bacterium]
MNRRTMIKTAAVGAAALGTGGCSSASKQKAVIPRKPKAEPREMVYRPLGKTGITVSLLGFGSHLTAENIKKPQGRDRQVQEAIENGVTLFDVYDHGSYRQFAPMSKSLAGKRQKVVISLVTVKPDIRQEIEETLRTFHTDYIDCYRAVYRDPSGYTKDDDGLETLFRLREEGKIRAVGVVAHNEPGLLHAVRNHPIDYIMMPINFHHNKSWTVDSRDSYSTVIPLCREKGVGILGIKPLGGDPMVAFAQHIGLLSPEYRGPSYPQAAFRYLWQNQDISSSFPSINSVGELYENLDTIWRPELTAEDRGVLKELSRKVARTLGAYLPPHYKWMDEWHVREA